MSSCRSDAIRRRRGSARMRIANVSEPESGSVIACAPISVPSHSPWQAALLSALRCRASRRAPRRPAGARTARRPARRRGSRSPAPRARCAQDSASAPLPPYSSGTGNPWMPISAHLRHSSRENVCVAIALDAHRRLSSALRELDDAVAQAAFCSLGEGKVHQRISLSR